MKIEILRIPDCPNWHDAETHIREALSALERSDVDLTVRLLTTEEDAARVPFAGSPTILIDGRDPFPSSGTTTELTCRIYRTEDGFAGAPSTEQLLDALSAAR
jgi:hypothetical protein